MTYDWIAAAQAGFKEHTGRPGPRFSSQVAVSDTGHGAGLRLRSSAVIGQKAHMSSDQSAFEAWCLVLHCWAGASLVTLDWEDSPEPHSRSQEQKHQQFLYRVANFQSLFGDWFAVAEPHRLELSLLRKIGSRFYLNSAGAKEHPIGRGKAEDTLERAMRNDPAALIKHLALSSEASVGRQFPVGVFSSPTPSESSRVFPSGFVDLVCVDGPTIGVLELKAGGTPPVGTLSELMFYVSVVRDLILGTFSIEQVRENARPGIRRGAFEGATEIIGVMIGNKLPPWLAHHRIFHCLNTAASTRLTSPRVSFRADRAEGDPPAFIAVAP